MSPIKILIADDEELILKSLKKKFNRIGYEVLLAEDGEKALNISKKEKPDVLLLDVKMPKLSGIEVCKQLKSKKGTRDIHIIIFSARAEEQDISIAKEVGADDYLTKPVLFDEIRERIEKYRNTLV